MIGWCRSMGVAVDMTKGVYRIGGIDIESTVLLPAPPSPPGVVPAAFIRCGAVADSLPDAAIKRVLCEASPTQCLLTIPGIARYLVHGGTEIIVDARRDAAVGDVVRYLVTYAFAALCHQRQVLVLHATAVDIHGAAALFSGPSASGKSTLGAGLAARGHRVLCDDVCVIDTSGESAVVHPACAGLALWADTLEQLGCVSVRDQREPYLSSPGVPAVFIGTPCLSAVPFSCLFLIAEADSSKLTIDVTEARPVEALARLEALTFMPFLITGLNRQAPNFVRCGRALRQAAVLTMARRWGFDSLPQVLDRIESVVKTRTANADQPAVRRSGNHQSATS